MYLCRSTWIPLKRVTYWQVNSIIPHKVFLDIMEKFIGWPLAAKNSGADILCQQMWRKTPVESIKARMSELEKLIKALISFSSSLILALMLSTGVFLHICWQSISAPEFFAAKGHPINFSIISKNTLCGIIEFTCQ